MATLRRIFKKGNFVGRHMTRDDMMTFDSVFAQIGSSDHPGKPLGGRYKTADGKTVDSTGAFLVGELERLDMTLHEPLAAVSWGRDIDLREDVTIADEVSSFTVSTYGSPGGLGAGNSIGNGKAWIGKDTTQVTAVSVDIGKVTHPLTPWAMELKFTVLELESAAKIGRPIDVQKFNAMKLKHQMDIDEMVYFGDLSINQPGLVSIPNAGQTPVVPVNVVAGAAGATQWAQKTADEILADVNTAIVSVWAASGWAVMPNKIGIPPAQYGQICTQKVSLAGNISVLKYLMENNLIATSRGKLDIVPMKWTIGAGVGGNIGVVGVDRMVVYHQDKDRVRFPMTLLARTPVQYDGLYHKTTYYCRLGAVELVYPQTIGYFDGI